jgi:hypothetical protein
VYARMATSYSGVTKRHRVILTSLHLAYGMLKDVTVEIIAMLLLNYDVECVSYIHTG